MLAPDGSTTRKAIWLAGTIIVLAVLAVYQNSFGGVFVFDDPPAIPNNPTIRHLWPLGPVLSPPTGRGLTVEGRPLLNLSFAVNYAVSGKEVWSYHVGNFAIHALAALLLFGIMRRTLARQKAHPDSRAGRDACWLAFVVALLWAVHPLQTESVTYVVQRAESLMGMLYLLTLYGFVRAVDASPTEQCRKIVIAWQMLSGIACLLGMATKEVMVSAPVMVLLYDRVFVAGNFRAAWRQRRGYYLALAATWLLLATLVYRGGATRSGTAGVGTPVSSWQYALTQCEAIRHYLSLTLWPHPLVFDYGTNLAEPSLTLGLGALLLATMLAGTVVALRRGMGAGFLGVWFFAILAPSSSIVPVATQTLAEHRMYLPLAAVLALAMLALYGTLERKGIVLGLAASVVFGVTTFCRNQDYLSELTLHRVTVAARPQNARAHYNLGTVLWRLERASEAEAQFEEAIRLKPGYADAHNRLGNVLLEAGHPAEAIAHYEAALRAEPDHVAARYDLGNARLETGKIIEAVACYEEAMKLDSRATEPRAGLAGAFVLLGRLPEAIRLCENLLQADPDNADAHYNLANALAETGRVPEALAHYEQALRLRPKEAKTHYNFANALAIAGRVSVSIAHYQRALAIQPDYPEAHYNWGNELARLRRLDEAIAHYREAIRLRPNYADAHNNLGGAFLDSGRLTEAAAEFEETLRLRPDFADARVNLNRLRSLQRSDRP